MSYRIPDKKLTIAVRDPECIDLIEWAMKLYNQPTYGKLVLHLLRLEKAKQDFGMVNINVK